MMKTTWINRIVWPLFIAALIWYVVIVLKPFLFFHLQQTPFLFGTEYFVQFFDRPGGMVHYLSQFIMQGFYHNGLSSFILVTLLLLQSVLLMNLLKRLFRKINLVWPFVLLISSLVILNSYSFPLLVLVQLIFVLLALIAVSRISFSSVSGWITFFFLYFLVYLVVGPGSALVFVTGATIILFFTLSLKSLYKSAVLLITATLFPYLSFKFIFNINLEEAYFNFIPPTFILSKYLVSIWFYIYVFLIPLLILLAALLKFVQGKLPDPLRTRLNNSMVTLALLIILGLASVFILKGARDESAQNIALCDYYNYHGEYEKTIAIALATKDEYDVFINLAYNRAISATGEFTKRLLEYPQLLGSRILQPDILGSPVFSMDASDLYYDLGYISQSQHAAYGVLAIEPDHPRAKMRLVQTNILLGNYPAAKVYLASLAKSFHTGEFVEKYTSIVDDPARINDDPALAARLKMIPDNFAIPAQMKERLRDLIRKDDSNFLASEYLQACHLLDHQLGDFMRDLDPALKFYNRIPDVYGQAIIMYFFNEGKPGMEEYNIEQLSKNKFNEFVRVMAISGNDKAVARDSLEFLSDSYMYYVSYLSPKVTRVELIQEKY